MSPQSNNNSKVVHPHMGPVSPHVTINTSHHNFVLNPRKISPKSPIIPAISALHHQRSSPPKSPPPPERCHTSLAGRFPRWTATSSSRQSRTSTAPRRAMRTARTSSRRSDMLPLRRRKTSPPQVPYFENVEECVEVPIEICYDVDEQV